MLIAGQDGDVGIGKRTLFLIVLPIGANACSTAHQSRLDWKADMPMARGSLSSSNHGWMLFDLGCKSKLIEGSDEGVHETSLLVATFKTVLPPACLLGDFKTQAFVFEKENLD
jgi:hypothetical protein